MIRGNLRGTTDTCLQMENISLWAGREDKGILFPEYFVSLLNLTTGKELWRATKIVVRLPFRRIAGNCWWHTLIERTWGLILPCRSSYSTRRQAPQVKEFGQTTIIPAGVFSFSDTSHRIEALAFSPDGKSFLSGDQGGRYRLWDVATGTMVRQLKSVDEAAGTMLNTVPSVKFSPDGKTAVVASLASARLFDVSTGNELATLISFRRWRMARYHAERLLQLIGKGRPVSECHRRWQAVLHLSTARVVLPPDLVKARSRARRCPG